MLVGIGRTIAVSFAVEGCHRIAIIDQDLPALEETAQLIQEASAATEVQKLQVDVRNETDVTLGFTEALRRFHRIDYAVNCAGKYLRPIGGRFVRACCGLES